VPSGDGQADRRLGERGGRTAGRAGRLGHDPWDDAHASACEVGKLEDLRVVTGEAGVMCDELVISRDVAPGPDRIVGGDDAGLWARRVLRSIATLLAAKRVMSWYTPEGWPSGDAQSSAAGRGM